MVFAAFGRSKLLLRRISTRAAVVAALPLPGCELCATGVRLALRRLKKLLTSSPTRIIWKSPATSKSRLSSIYGTQKRGNDFIAPWVEFEYGAKAWWTTEFYLDGQGTFHDSALFTGFRWENRFRPLMREHWINPVLYVEYENTNGADKTMIEVVGFDDQADHAVPNSEAQQEHQHELETKLILSSDYKGWNISENFIGEKNLGHDPWEFGYAVGASRPLRLAATSNPCNFCRENFLVGAEIYGGLGTSWNATLSGTSHYVAPMVGWQLPSGAHFESRPASD